MGQKLKKGQKTKERKDYTRDHKPIIPPIIPPKPYQPTLTDEDLDLRTLQLLYEIGDIKYALDRIQPIIEEEPDDPRFWCLYARIQQSLDNFDEAERLMQKTLAINPDNPDTLWTFIDILCISGRYDRAEKLLERYLEVSGEEPLAYRRGCWIFIPEGKNEEVVWLVRRGREAAGDDIELIILEIRSLLALGRIDEAAEVIRSAPQKEEDLSRWLGLKGEVLNAQGNPDEAIRTINEGILTSPDHHFCYTSLARVLSSAGRLEEALDALDRAIEINDNTMIDDLFMRAKIQTTLGLFDEAEEDLAGIQAIQYRYPPMLELMETIRTIRPGKNAGIGYEIYKAKNYQLKEDWEELIRHLDQMKEKQYESPLMYTLRGQALADMDSYDDALEMFRIAIGMDPNSNHGYYHAALIHYNNDRLEEALALLEGRDDEKRDFGQLSLIKGLILISLSKFDEGRQLIQTALTRMPNKSGRIQALQQIALKYGEMKQRDEERAYYERILVENPNNKMAKMMLQPPSNKPGWKY